MLLDDKIKKLLSELVHTDVAHIEFGGSSITVKTFDHGKKLLMSTPVYFGGNYIPKSVRNCLNERPFNSYSIHTNFVVDEENYRIYLSYFDDVGNTNDHRFIDILEDFTELADQWRERLDEYDKNDRIYVRAR